MLQVSYIEAFGTLLAALKPAVAVPTAANRAIPTYLKLRCESNPTTQLHLGRMRLHKQAEIVVAHTENPCYAKLCRAAIESTVFSLWKFYVFVCNLHKALCF
jgi:hypothetical protein